MIHIYYMLYKLYWTTLCGIPSVMDVVTLLSVLALISSTSPISAQIIDSYKCKRISVTGAKRYPSFNGIYDKTLECNLRSMYKKRDTIAPVYLFYREGEDRWAIGQPSQLGDCSILTRNFNIVGNGNKLYPHMVDADWEEFIGSVPERNPDLNVECDEVFWTMGCSTVNFPLPQHPTRCHNATSAIEVQNVYVINYPAGQATSKCPSADQRCFFLRECDLDAIGLTCSRKIPEDDYEYKLVQKHCDGRHVNCHPFKVDPLFHRDCNTRATFPCDEVVRPDVRDGIVVEYKCKRSRKYIGPEVAPVDVPDKPIQTLSSCSTTRSPRKVDDGEGDDQNADATLINIVAPAAGALFGVIILAVIIVTVRRRRRRQQQASVQTKISQSNQYLNDNTYSNISALGATPSQRPPKRPDLAAKKPKKSQKIALTGDMSSTDLDAVVKAVVDANPQLKGGMNGNNNGVCAVVILDQQGVPIVPGDTRHGPPNGQLPVPMHNGRFGAGPAPSPDSRAGSHISQAGRGRPISTAGYVPMRTPHHPAGPIPRMSASPSGSPAYNPSYLGGPEHSPNNRGLPRNSPGDRGGPNHQQSHNVDQVLPPLAPAQHPRGPVHNNPPPNYEHKYQQKKGDKKKVQKKRGNPGRGNASSGDGHLQPITSRGYNNHAYTT